ncbi:MAG: DUF2313 domain-containing protein [Roseomonas sp.]|nr:DUF2313 domain-containing protein [Roseomonas sp.]
MDASAYLSQLLGLLPPGDALPREPGSRLERLLSVPAAELARVDGRVEALLREADPARTTEMLADWERALGLPDECYPNEKFSRASTAWYFDGAGVLREAAVDEPRYLYDAAGQRTEAVLVEDVATNGIRNPAGVDAIVGTPGTMPTNWAAFPISGLSIAVAGFGIEDGIAYVDFRISGTASASPAASIIRADQVYRQAAQNDIWTYSQFMRVVAGSLTGFSQCRLYVTAWNAGGAFLGQYFSSVAPSGARLAEQRYSITATLLPATTGLGGSQLDFLPNPNTTVDVTLRIGLPQLERGQLSSPIRPPLGTIAATTRAADQLYIATVQERRQRILARLIERFEPTPAAIIGLAARLGDTVTLTEFRPHDCEMACEAPVLDDAWAHAFQVAGGAQQVVEFTCEDHCETPLSQWRTGRYECAIRRFAPAHTVPIFSYA